MNNALFIISVQHELAMAIGNKLDLKDMLKVFLKVCFNRLSLTSAHIYTYCDSNGLPIKLATQKNASYQHLLSMPKMNSGLHWPDDEMLIQFVKSLNEIQENHSFQVSENKYLFGFIIPQHGLLVFQTNYLLEESVQRALTPILQKLSISYYTSIVHDSLVQEVKSRKIAEDKIIFQAQHDELTKLYNRQHLNVLLAEDIDDSIRNNHFGCVIFIDLNRFKPINDAMGHAVGDQILMLLSTRLLTLSDDNQVVARFGGDEFILLLKKLPLNYQVIVEQSITQINRLLSRPFEVNSASYKLNCSIGYAIYPEQSINVNDTIKFADIAMYEAKNTKTLLGLKYHETMSDKINKRIAYVEEIKHALINNDFKLYYQAQYNHNGDIVGAEALLRWLHPVNGMESPSVYIPIAEESDLILFIGEWVLEQACQDIYALEQIGLPTHFKNIAINVSAKQLIQHDFENIVLNTIEENNISPSHLVLELTESLLVENIEHSIELLSNFKSFNIDCAIDDFGTGYSSLTYLQRIPASVLKIDRSFVTNIDKSKDSAAIASMIIGLAKTLNMKVLAEGVETLEELACLKSLGCYNYQGFYFSKPMPFSDFVELLSKP